MVRLRRPGRALPAEPGRSPSKLEDAAALRREPAPARGAVYAGRPARERHRPGRAGAGQGAQLQQPQRRQRGVRAVVRVPRRRADASSSSSTPTRAESPPAPLLLDAWREALACDSVSAFGGIVAVNRPLDAATAEAIAADLHRSRRRARRRRRRARDLRAQEEPAAAADRRAARPGAAGQTLAVDHRRPAGPGPRQWHGHRRPAQMRDPARADRAGAGRLPVRLDASPSTSSPTPSSTPRTGSPPASAPAR